uniref:Cotton fiber protein n=1 Tax=Davidia involucrata TaxID=16924 RepID=A0A5B7BJI4_DAVIN
MPKKKSDVAGRAWNILRLALLWARKGGLLFNFKRRAAMMDLPRLLPGCRYLKSLLLRRHSTDQRSAIGHYGERELSFDGTPIIHIKMHRPSSTRFRLPHLPCINNPQVDFDYDFDVDQDQDQDQNIIDQHHDTTSNYYINDDGARKSFLKGGGDHEDEDHGCNDQDQMVPCDEEGIGIDIKAEEFIAKFYEQMKLQRQISYLQYSEMLNRGASN